MIISYDNASISGKQVVVPLAEFTVLYSRGQLTGERYGFIQ